MLHFKCYYACHARLVMGLICILICNNNSVYYYNDVIKSQLHRLRCKLICLGMPSDKCKNEVFIRGP